MIFFNNFKSQMCYCDGKLSRVSTLFVFLDGWTWDGFNQKSFESLIYFHLKNWITRWVENDSYE